MKYIFICGISGSGKGLLRTLLDGHSHVATCPFQGYGYDFIDKPFNDLLRRDRPYATLSRMKKIQKSIVSINNYGVTIGELFRVFSRSYGEVVDASLSKKIRAASSAEGEVFVDFDLNIHNFNNSVYESLKEQKSFSVNEVFSIFTNALISNWRNINTDRKNIKYFSQSSHNGVEVIKNIIKNIPDSKIIIVDRDPVDLIYTNTKRNLLKRYGLGGYQKILENRNSFVFFNKFSRHLFSQNFINKVKDFKLYTSLIDKNKQIHVVKFEQLVMETKSEMNKIAHFLDINYEDILARATLNSVDMESNDNKFVGTINDSSDQYVSGAKKKLLKLMLNT